MLLWEPTAPSPVETVESMPYGVGLSVASQLINTYSKDSFSQFRSTGPEGKITTHFLNFCRMSALPFHVLGSNNLFTNRYLVLFLQRTPVAQRRRTFTITLLPLSWALDLVRRKSPKLTAGTLKVFSQSSSVLTMAWWPCRLMLK